MEIGRAFPDKARIAELEAENQRLRTGLNIIAQGAALYGPGWCAAQAIGWRDDLDFDHFPKTGRASSETSSDASPVGLED